MAAVPAIGGTARGGAGGPQPDEGPCSLKSHQEPYKEPCKKGGRQHGISMQSDRNR